MPKLTYTIAAILLLSGAGLASAHHANSMYDHNEEVSVTGTVTRWEFINPHAGLWVDVTDEQGNVQEWSAEFQGTLDLYRHFSFNKDTFKSGDTITLIGFRARNGDPTLGTRVVIFPDGRRVDVRSAPD